MAKKSSVRADSEASKPKQLRKRLRKAEDQLADATAKRDRAQARVEALSIIADEIRAQLAEADKAAPAAAATAAESKPARRSASAAARRPGSSMDKPPAKPRATPRSRGTSRPKA